MNAAHAIARRVLEDGLAIDTDEVRALAAEVLRLHAQRAPGDPGIEPPPVDRDALRRAVEDADDYGNV